MVQFNELGKLDRCESVTLVTLVQEQILPVAVVAIELLFFPVLSQYCRFKPGCILSVEGLNLFCLGGR